MLARQRGGRLSAALVAALFAVPAFAASASHAETPAPPSAEAKQLELRGLQQELEASEVKRKALAGEISALEGDRAKLESTLIATTKQVSDNEARIAENENRLATLTTRGDALKRSLQSRRAVVAEVLAALQRMGRKPPPALLVEPDDVLAAIRTSMLLGALLPGMRAETDALVADLSELSRTRKAIEAEKIALDHENATLAGDRHRLTDLIEVRQAALSRAHGDMVSEQTKADKLSGEASSLKELIGRMERESVAVGKAAEAARRSDEKLAAMLPDGAQAVKPPTQTPRDPARLAPAIAFASTKGLLPRPVSGQILRRFGDDDGLGSTEKGEAAITRPNAVVSAPADVWVAFAGPYRSFGKVLILNAGGGYYIVLAGMDRINVNLGQFVLAGEPVAVMGDGSTRTAAAVALSVTQPILYVEFRKDGATIDPGPWWARSEIQKVRG